MSAGSANGPRPVNLRQDIPQILKLLELVFGKSIGAEGRRMLSSNLALSLKPAPFWRLSPDIGKLSLGYVWEEDGVVIANATVLNTKMAGRYLVVNVAVHPDFRQQGIARGLMETIITSLRAQDAKEILLQVEAENVPAINLYNSLAFNSLGTMNSWRTTVSRLRAVQEYSYGQYKPRLRKLHRNEWQAAYELDLTCLKPELNWPEALPIDIFRRGIWHMIDKFVNGRQSEAWVIVDTNNQMLALNGIWSEWGRAHRVSLRILPEWRGKLERQLLANTVHRLRYLPRRNIRLDHPADDEIMNQLLQDANFSVNKTLTHMRLML